MMSNPKEFIVYRDTIVEALDHLEEFEDKMKEFVKKNPKFLYKADINLVGSVWEIKVNVHKKDEQINIKTT
jgi:hypothetical protein